MAGAEPVRQKPVGEQPPPSLPVTRRRPRPAWRRLPQWPLMLILPGGLFALWYLSSTANTVVAKFIPRPADVLDTGYEIFTSGYRGSSIFTHTWTSLSHVISAFVII